MQKIKRKKIRDKGVNKYYNNMIREYMENEFIQGNKPFTVFDSHAFIDFPELYASVLNLFVITKIILCVFIWIFLSFNSNVGTIFKRKKKRRKKKGQNKFKFSNIFMFQTKIAIDNKLRVKTM